MDMFEKQVAKKKKKKSLSDGVSCLPVVCRGPAGVRSRGPGISHPHQPLVQDGLYLGETKGKLGQKYQAQYF